MIKRMTLALAALLFGASMHMEAFAQTSQIRDMTGNWTGDDPRLIKPRLLPKVASTGFSFDRVDATFARHLWPGGDLAHRVAAVFDRAISEWRTTLSLGQHGGGELVYPVGGFLSSACYEPIAANPRVCFTAE